MAPNQEQQTPESFAVENATGEKTLMCYGRTTYEASAWKAFLSALCFQNEEAPWVTDQFFPEQYLTDTVPLKKQTKVGDQNISLQLPPVSYSRNPNYAALDSALQSSDGYIVFVEGHYCFPESYMDRLKKSLEGHSDATYATFYFRRRENAEAYRLLPKQPAEKTRGIVVVFCGHNDETCNGANYRYHYENAKKAWGDYCNKEGFPCFEFNPKESADKVKESATTIVEALLAEIKVDRGIKVKTQRFPQDFSFPAFLELRKASAASTQKKESTAVWTRFKRFVGLSTAA